MINGPQKYFCGPFLFLPPGTIKKCFQNVINIIFATILPSATDSQINEARDQYLC